MENYNGHIKLENLVIGTKNNRDSVCITGCSLCCATRGGGVVLRPKDVGGIYALIGPQDEDSEALRAYNGRKDGNFKARRIAAFMNAEKCLDDSIISTSAKLGRDISNGFYLCGQARKLQEKDNLLAQIVSRYPNEFTLINNPGNAEFDGYGCAIYESRPAECRKANCNYSRDLARISKYFNQQPFELIRDVVIDNESLKAKYGFVELLSGNVFLDMINEPVLENRFEIVKMYKIIMELDKRHERQEKSNISK